METQQRALRADSERTMRTILEAAEQVLSVNPAATIEQIAEAAGVARSTVHRRFVTRNALLDALIAWATEQFHTAVTAARPESAPPLVALYQVTANVLRVKIGWRFAMDQVAPSDPAVANVHADVLARCDNLFRRAQDAGLVRADVDLRWAMRVYHALIDEASRGNNTGENPDSLATAIVHTLLHGVGTDTARL